MSSLPDFPGFHWLFLLVLLIVPCEQADAEQGKPVLVLDADSKLHTDFAAALDKQWSARQGDGKKLSIDHVYLDADTPDPLRMPPGTGLVITVGSAAARAVSELEQDKPVLNTLIPESVYNSITVTPGECNHHSAIFIDQPVGRQQKLAELVFPDRAEYGLLLGPVSAHRLTEIEQMQHTGNQRLTIRIVEKGESTMAAGRELLAASDVLLAVNDPQVMNRENAKWLLYVAYQRRLPVIGFSKAYVRAGAAASVYSDLGQIARQTAEITSEWLRPDSGCLPAATYPEYFSVAVNTAVSRSLGSVTTDEDLLADALREDESR